MKVVGLNAYTDVWEGRYVITTGKRFMSEAEQFLITIVDNSEVGSSVGEDNDSAVDPG